MCDFKNFFKKKNRVAMPVTCFKCLKAFQILKLRWHLRAVHNLHDFDRFICYQVHIVDILSVCMMLSNLSQHSVGLVVLVA